MESLVLTKELCHEIKEFKQQRRQLTATATKTSIKLSEYTLHRTFSRFFFISFNMSNVGKFFWSSILEHWIIVPEKKKSREINAFLRRVL